MGDLLGSPRVAFLFFWFYFFLFFEHQTIVKMGDRSRVKLPFICFKGRISGTLCGGRMSSVVGEPSTECGHKRKEDAGYDGCDHTSTKAPDPMRTPKLSVLGRE
jgi:hypothetical protein